MTRPIDSAFAHRRRALDASLDVHPCTDATHSCTQRHASAHGCTAPVRGSACIRAPIPCVGAPIDTHSRTAATRWRPHRHASAHGYDAAARPSPCIRARIRRGRAPIAMHPCTDTTRPRAHRHASVHGSALKERKPPGRQDRQVRNHRGFGSFDPGVLGVLAVHRPSSAPCSDGADVDFRKFKQPQPPLEATCPVRTRSRAWCAARRPRAPTRKEN